MGKSIKVVNMAKVTFTGAKVSKFKCPADKTQVFMWDAATKGLGVRATPSGKPAYVFQAPYQGRDIRLTIGSPAAWTLSQAQEKARELQRLIDEGKDPRGLKLDALETQAAKTAADKANTLTIGDVWSKYIEERKPFWGALHYRDHIDKAKAGGLPSQKRGGKFALTKPGPLAALMPMKLSNLDQSTIEKWAAKEGEIRPSSARLAWRLLTVFLTWCSEQPEYSALLPQKNPAKNKKAREALGKPNAKTDVLQRGQLAPWFTAIQNLQNPVISASFQVMLLTGARPGEVLSLRWEDINTIWKCITIRDKVEGERDIPLTPYVSQLIHSLPRRNKWVFSSPTSQSGCLSEPNTPHTRACRIANIESLTLHGLRRSFKSLTEWLEVPVGVVAQIQGHKPSATAEKHYTVRPLELLALHHERIEAWILEQAEIKVQNTPALHLVTS